jgi:phosphatidylserine decarboxylase
MIILFLLALIFIFVIFLIIWRYFFFYRNPNREIQYDQKSILSPADGFIVYCKRVNPKENIFSIKKNKQIKLDELMNIDDNSLKNKPGWLIGIFMTFFDVHYNRSPIGGHIKKIRHNFPKRFKKNYSLRKLYLNLFFSKNNIIKNCDYLISNERASYIVKNKKISVYVTQIADRWVNKIVTYKNDEEIKQGEIFGLIKIGSQVDIFVPDAGNKIEILVKERQRVKAGLTKLLRIKKYSD